MNFVSEPNQVRGAPPPPVVGFRFTANVKQTKKCLASVKHASLCSHQKV